MKINKVDMLCTKIEVKENKEKSKYLMITLLDLSAGDSFDIISKDIELLGKIRAMTKVKCNLNLTSSKYGLKLEIADILEDLGAI